MSAAAGKDAQIKVIGRYALHRKISHGGMAQVHLGRLLGEVGFTRVVAIKRLHAHYARDERFVTMFLDEARLAARIRHPNVVPTLDVVVDNGEMFLVMEYVHGDSLSHLITAARAKGVRIPPAIASAIVIGALHGLHAAHEAKSEKGEPLGIVHRDISPQNILVGSDGVPRVLDFGIAKAAGRLQETADGSVKGKLVYMAPEHLGGEAVSRTTDIYAAGLVLWELITGTRAFNPEEDYEALRAKVLTGQVDAPSKHMFKSMAATITKDMYDALADLDAFTLRALDLDPNRRFATAREMALALERIVPPASTAQVSDWVESLAGPTLDERARMVAEVETGISIARPDARAVLESLDNEPAGPSTAILEDRRVATSVREPAFLAAEAQAEAETSPSGVEPARPRRQNVVVIAIVVAVLVGAIGGHYLVSALESFFR